MALAVVPNVTSKVQNFAPEPQLPEDRRQAAQEKRAPVHVRPADMPEQLVQQAELQSQLLSQQKQDDEAGDLVEAVDLKRANIELPPGFKGERMSFTATIPGSDSRATIEWKDASVYVKKSRGLKEPVEIKIDKKGGSTLSVRKYGGWMATWKMAQKCARPL
ncbi:hypothetical protein AK812_SmicGene47164 [Symbiodinium microadriaticum]|uniref:Uncharacterized protein n=1 Tax=Symbiodinium microadriaticum TaxID=2951 RepID=A0A1Q9BS87_SYMMI|nr:hypothetical protein AK812_SmicGene47164 [Symbiodinium microadriaticum]